MTVTTQNKKDNSFLSNQSSEIEELSAIERVVVQGDLSPLSASQRVIYYKKVCESAGLNPFTKPFEYIMLNGKLTLYAKKDCTEQLRKLNGISITSLEDKLVDDIYIVTAKATTKDGRTDQSKGAVVIGHLKGEHKANAIMKAETKAKRRVTLSISGMGFCDESEVDSIPNAKTMEIDLGTGDIKEVSTQCKSAESAISDPHSAELLGYLAECSVEYQKEFGEWLKVKKWNSLKDLPVTEYDRVKKVLVKKSEECQNFFDDLPNIEVIDATGV